MYIVGVGSAYPDNELSNDFLVSLGLPIRPEEAELISRFGIAARRTVLPLEYLVATKNSDVGEAYKAAQLTPTMLGAAAARHALEMAGIDADQLGLVVTDSGTPHETCPSEAHRVIGALGVKIPCYDVVAGPCALSFFLQMAATWRDDRIPDYFMFVSTNTPTEYLQYGRGGVAPYLFGDGAAAFIISSRKKGPFKVLDTAYARLHPAKPLFMLDRDIAMRAENLLPQGELSRIVSQAVAQSVGRFSLRREAMRIVGPQNLNGDMRKLDQELGGSDGHVITVASRIGYTLGASAGIAVADTLPTLHTGDSILVVDTGDGVSNGHVLVSAE